MFELTRLPCLVRGEDEGLTGPEKVSKMDSTGSADFVVLSVGEMGGVTFKFNNPGRGTSVAGRVSSSATVSKPDPIPKRNQQYVSFF